MNFKPGMNILLSSYYTRCKSRAPPTFGMGGASARVNRIRKTPFFGPLWRLTARDRRLALASNIGSVKQKVQTASKPRLKPRALTGLKQWQVEKWQKIAFCAKLPLFSNLLTFYTNLTTSNSANKLRYPVVGEACQYFISSIYTYRRILQLCKSPLYFLLKFLHRHALLSL